MPTPPSLAHAKLAVAGAPMGMAEPSKPPLLHARTAPSNLQPTYGSTDVGPSRADLLPRHTLFAVKAAPAPTLLDRTLAARPHVAFETALDRGLPGAHARIHALVLNEKMANHPGAILALFAISAACLGTVTTVKEVGDTGRALFVAWPLEALTHTTREKAGRVAALPIALLCETSCLTLGVSTRCVATACGLTAGIVTGLLLGPVLVLLPKAIEAPLADALVAYLRLQKRFAQAEAAIQNFNPFHHHPEVQAEEHHHLSHALDALHEQLQHITGMTPTTISPTTTATGASPTPQTRAQTAYQRLLAKLVKHPQVTRRVGLPEPPTRKQALPVHERLLAHLLKTQPEQAPHHVLG